MQQTTVRLILISLLALLPAGGDTNNDPVLGSWRLNTVKPQFSTTTSASVMRSYQASGSGLTRISETRLIPGGQMLIEYATRYDGEESPIFVREDGWSAPIKSDSTVSFRRINRYTVTGLFRNQGNRTSEFTRIVSADGQHLLVRVLGIDSTGDQTVTVLVYDRITT